MAKTLSSIADYFGIDESEVVTKVVPVVSNGDVDAFGGVVVGALDSDGLSVKAKAPGAYRAKCYLFMP